MNIENWAIYCVFLNRAYGALEVFYPPKPNIFEFNAYDFCFLASNGFIAFLNVVEWMLVSWGEAVEL